MIVFQFVDFGGAHARTALDWYYVGDWWNDRICSIVVIAGRWRFYEHLHYAGANWELGPGYYRRIDRPGIVSSFRATEPEGIVGQSQQHA